MVYDYFDKYTFLCEMYDADADAIIELVLNYFPFDNSCQVLNAKKGHNLVRRVQLPTLKLEMLQIGNIVNIFSKLLLITDCAPATRKTLFNKVESTFAMIKPVSPDIHGKIITYITKKGFRIVRLKNGKISKELAMTMYSNIAGSSMLPIVIDYITSGEVVGLELVGPNAVVEWRRCLGATDPIDAEPGTLRKLYGENKLRNIAHGCHTGEDARMMLELFFGYDKGIPRVPFRSTLTDCTCCVIKPHAVLDGNVGAILEQISTAGKFHISAMAMFSVKLPNAEEFYEVYKGVIPEYEASCIHLAEGKCLALEVKCTDTSLNSVTEFRKLCGPRDPDTSSSDKSPSPQQTRKFCLDITSSLQDLCRQLYPDSIRALYGKTLVHNAVHCTDLPEDGETEVEYFFKLLANE